MRIEVVPGLKMRRKQQDEAGVSVIGRRAVGIVPEQIAKSRRGRAHIGMRVVAVDAPRLQRALHDEVVSRAAYVIHDLFAAIFLKRFAHARAESLQHFVPRSPRPFSATPRPGALHRIKDAIGIMNLRDRRRALRAKASATGWMLRVALELRDLSGFFIDVGKKSARRLAVEANGRNKLVMLLDAARPGLSIVLDPIVPLFDRRVGREMTAVAFEIGHS